MLRLAGLGVPVFAPEGAELPAPLPVTRVRVGERFTAAGFAVTAVGGRHASMRTSAVCGTRSCPYPGRRSTPPIMHPPWAVGVRIRRSGAAGPPAGSGTGPLQVRSRRPVRAGDGAVITG